MTELRPQGERHERRHDSGSPSPTIFADSAYEYARRGFTPVPWRVYEGGKRPAARGYLLPDPPIVEWVNAFPDAGIGIVSRGWLGIDVDAAEHGGKTGDITLSNLENALGALPATLSSTARGKDSKSRIYFFGIPEDDRKYRDVGKDIEAIRPGHRFAAVAPSIHPNGKAYVWYDRDGEPMGIPSRFDFAPLPEAWIEYLTAPAQRDGGYDGSVQDWLDALPGDEAPDFVRARLDFTEGEFGHSELVSILMSLVSSGARGRPGIRPAIELVRDRWLRGMWNDADHQKEFDDALDWAVARAGGAHDEEEQSSAEQRFKDASAPPELPVDHSSLAEAFRIHCRRLDRHYEDRLIEDANAAAKYRQSLDLLPNVRTQDQAKQWLEATKTAMTRALGEPR